MKSIPLTKGYSALVDDNDFNWINQWKWSARTSKDGQVYAIRWDAEVAKFVYMHRLINSTPSDQKTDHRDGDGLNNQRENLRTATNAQNAMNAKRHKDSLSRFKGVTKNPKKGKPWVAGIGINGKRCHIGTFATEEEAALAYTAKARELFGEFAGHYFGEQK